MMVKQCVRSAFTLCLALAAGSLLGAQEVSDPLYASIDRWEARGYLEPLYMLRPYSPEVVRSILERVVQVGGRADAETASRYLERYGDLRFEPAGVQRSDARFGGESLEYHGDSGAGFFLSSNLLPGVWAQGTFEVLLIDGGSAVKPVSERSVVDIQQDGSMSFLPTGLSGEAMSILYGLSSSTWFGTEKLWASASYARSSAGPFFGNGTIIGPQVHAAPNWTLNAASGGFRFSGAVFQLTQHAGPGEKYLAYHAYSYAPIDALDFGFFESTVWGGSFKPQYLVPFSLLYYLQSLGINYGDNSLVGLYSTWRPVDGLVAKATVFLDDVGFSDLVAFDLDTKIIGAGQAGLSWAPEAGPVSLVSLDYTAIFPYMYAHLWTHAEDDYTHYGDSFGAALQPNSERWELRARFVPLSSVSIDAVSRLIRHGNASEGIYDGDGTWYDNGWVSGAPTYQEPFITGTSPEYFRFLTQDTIETVFQAGATVSYAGALGRTNLSVAFRYLFEAKWNDGLVPGSNNLYHYMGLDASLSL